MRLWGSQRSADVTAPLLLMAVLLVALLGGCAAPPDAADGDDSGAAATTCDPLTVTLTEEWLEADLPAYEDRRHTPAGVALGDIDGDGWLDALMAFGGGATALRNDGTGRLVLAPEWSSAGAPLPKASAASLVDLDGDGDLDFYLGREDGQEDVVLYNRLRDGGGFVSAPIAGSTSATSTGAFADFDGDGDLDLFLAATTTDTEGLQVIDGEADGDGCMLFLQDDAGIFVDETARLPAHVLNGWTFQGSPIDADGDGDLDVYMANDFGAWLLPNQLLLNDGHANFTVADDCHCDLVMFGMGAAVGDANGDALPDLYVTDLGGPNLLVNDGVGAFYDATLALGADVPFSPTNLTSWGAAFVDLDQDSWNDLAVTFGQLGQPEIIEHLDGGAGWEDGPLQPDVLLLGSAAGFTRVDVGWNDPSRTRAVAVGDLDRDGRPDLVTAGKYFLRQWHTDGGCAPGVRVTVDAGQKNRQGLGSRVQVTLGERVLTQWMLPSTTGSSSAPELYFGLGGAAGAARVTVTWPDGTTSEAEDVSAGDLLAFVK
ncbi:MAG: CRTAC1 family protein [Myxococcota bacterium]